MPRDLIRAFFHEVGHFVAREISSKHFEVSPPASIDLYPSGKMLWHYEGSFSPTIPKGQENNDEVINMPEKIVGLVYGCFFESLYFKVPFTACFDYRGNGSIDIDHWAGLLTKHGINGGEEKRRALIKNDEAYFDQLEKDNFFDEISQIDVMALLIEDKAQKGVYSVDIEKLREVLRPFLEEHEKIFLPYLERTRTIINK
jgi:hypothetical protein